MRLYRKVKKLFRNIKRVIDYVPIIWNNPDWDYEFFLDLIIFKLKRMQIAMENGMCVSSPDQAKQIALCIKILERVVNECYYYDKYGYKDQTAITMRQRDLEFVFKYMSKKLLQWWD